LSWVSPGEAIMRPEFTRAVGPGWVNAVNHAARTGGVGGVRSVLASGKADEAHRHMNQVQPQYAPAPKWALGEGSGFRNFSRVFNKYASPSELQKFTTKGQLPDNVTEAKLLPGKRGRDSLKDYYLGR